MSWFPPPATATGSRADRSLIRPAAIALALGLALAVTLVAAGNARAELVARGIDDGILALDPQGVPSVAYVRGTNVIVATRAARNRWRTTTIGSVTARSSVMAFRIGAKGPVALVQSADDRTLVLVRRRGAGWQRLRLAGSLPARTLLGWPGLVLTSAGLPVVAYTRWNSATLNSQLLLLRIAASGKIQTQQITAGGFPQSYAPPPAEPIIVRGRVHVVQSHGYGTVVAMIEWYPDRRTWTGLYLDAARGDFPVGPLLARTTRTGTVYAAWTVSMLGFGVVPVSLAVHEHDPVADTVLDRALATALALPASGPEIAANEWVSADELGLGGEARVWAGMVVRGRSSVELDGSILGYAAGPRGRDMLLGAPVGLSWFRSPRPLSTTMRIEAENQADGSALISGELDVGRAGRVTVYRERPGAARQVVGQAQLQGGSFSIVDTAAVQPLLYRAVYTDPATGIPYGALLRRPSGALERPGEPDEPDPPDDDEARSDRLAALKRLRLERGSPLVPNPANHAPRPRSGR